MFTLLDIGFFFPLDMILVCEEARHASQAHQQWCENLTGSPRVLDASPCESEDSGRRRRYDDEVPAAIRMSLLLKDRANQGIRTSSRSA